MVEQAQQAKNTVARILTEFVSGGSEDLVQIAYVYTGKATTVDYTILKIVNL